ncbi:hypothetical protein EI983_06110 [Roseovarius faecimaris]|uniref:Uncharacterized protein n=1 Tax=Roseovarius faecimaris TaxID=2494550 RepID=A0A6I6IPW7_9RHOB|nr:hypothetical protein [Roseovarius faecimaris]QGX97871.1 hypothetical protein EI983_06110 [Roseovarius faecimaris]
MTALSKYQRLEAAGLWRPAPDAQRTDVIISIGDATLTITDTRDRALAHWSLAAVERANPGQRPAIFFPDGDPGETLELGEDEAEMIKAIEKLRSAIARGRPHPGRLRLVMVLAALAVLIGLGVFWLPNAARDHAVRVVPQVKKAEIGAALLTHLQTVTGPPCRAGDGAQVLTRLARRIPAPHGPGQVLVMRDGVAPSAHLPGGTVLLNRSLVEDYEDPDVVAGYLVAERLRAELNDPLRDLLTHGGLSASVRLLATGALKDATLKSYAKIVLTQPPAPLSDDVLLAGFNVWKIRARPYAYAEDVSGETTLGLIEADPFAAEAPPPVLSDADWLRLQGICGG